MPPNLDIYGLTKRRDRQTISSFLDSYIDRAANEDRKNEELMLVPLNAQTKPEKLEDYEWEPSHTLTDIIRRGLDYPRRSFSVYFRSNAEGIDQVIMSFTTDNQLILGLSIDYEDALPLQMDRAKELLKEIGERHACHLGLIMVEQPPPANQAEFLNEADGPYSEVFWRFEGAG